MSKQWMSAAEIGALKLPGLPTDKKWIIARAARESWASRPRSGKGGGVEYALPQAAQNALDARALQKASPPQAINPEQLADWQRSALQARSQILHHIEAQAFAQNISLQNAEALFAEQAKAGKLTPALEKALKNANCRHNAGRTISLRTLRRWRAQANTELAPKHTAPPLHYPWLTRLMQLYARPTKPSIVWCLEEMRRQGHETPPHRTAQAVIARMGAIARHKGRVGSRELKRLRAYSARTINDLEPLDVISADGHTFKAEVRHPLHGGLFRPEIVTVIDIATRKVIGWSAGLSESAFLVADALRVAAAIGTAAILYTDNGCGFCNEYLDGPGLGVLARLGTTHNTAIAYNAQARGVIERLQATLWKREAKTLPAYVGHDMDRQAKHLAFKKGRAEMKATGHSKLYLEWPDFLSWCQKAVDRYNQAPHSSLPRKRNHEGRLAHESPNEAWGRHEAAGWSPTLASQEELDDLFRPYVMRTVRRSTVSLFGAVYFNRKLDDLDMHGQEVQVGYDIHDASRVWVRDGDGRLLCIAEIDAHASPYFPKSHIEQAQERRANRTSSPPLVEIESAQPLTPEQEAGAARQIAFLTPATPAKTGQERPIFADELSWVEWLKANPAAVTMSDRMHLQAALRQPSFRQFLEVCGVDCQALHCLASETLRQIA